MKITRILVPVIGFCSMLSLYSMNNQPPKQEKKFELTTKAGKKAAFVNLRNKKTLLLLLSYTQGFSPNTLKKYEHDTAFLRYLLLGQEEKIQRPVRCEIASCPTSSNESPLFFPGDEKVFREMIRYDQQAEVLGQQSASGSPHGQNVLPMEAATQQLRTLEISPLTRITPPVETIGEFKFNERDYYTTRFQRPESAPVDLAQLDQTLRFISANRRGKMHMIAHRGEQPRVLSAVLEDTITEENTQQTPHSPAYSFVPIIEAKNSMPQQTATREEDEEERQAQGLDDESPFIFPGEIEEINEERTNVLRAALSPHINTPHHSPSGCQSPHHG